MAVTKRVQVVARQIHTASTSSTSKSLDTHRYALLLDFMHHKVLFSILSRAFVVANLSGLLVRRLPSFIPATHPIKLSLSDLRLRRTWNDGSCTGPCLVASLGLNTSPNGLYPGQSICRATSYPLKRRSTHHRIPMYYLMKTLFLLYLVLPQTRGSSYIYINHLQPFLHSHESQIDATLASFKARLYGFIQERFRALWDQIVGALGQQQVQYVPGTSGVAVGAPPSLGDPVSGPAQLVAGLWRSYGPTLVASGAAFLSQGATASGSATEKAWRTPAGSQIHLDSAQSTRDRRRQSKAELQPQPRPVPVASGSFEASSRNSSDSELRVRGTGRFEEVDEPSDTEGYEADGRGKGSGSERAARPTNWFGWGPSGTREKSD
jgi:receptor expression-enhancing protein 1/2/3/4